MDSLACYYVSGAPLCLHHQALLCSALSGPSQRSARKPEGLLESNLRGDENTETFFFHKTGTEQKENPQTEMREFHKLPFVAK